MSKFDADEIAALAAKAGEEVRKYFPPLPYTERANGSWVLDQITKRESPLDSVEMFRAARDGSILDWCPPGQYWRLTFEGRPIMSDTPMELHSNHCAVKAATGRVLITGLGMLLVANAIASKDDVDQVVIIEKSYDLIKMMQDLAHDKITIIHADAFEWEPHRHGFKFDFAWHDIWPTVCADDLVEHNVLMKHYAPHVLGEQLCWMHDRLVEYEEEWA